MQFAYQFPEMTERLVLVSSGGLGPEVSLVLRAAALPGADLFIAATAAPARTAGNAIRRGLAAVGLRPAADVAEVARGYASLADGDRRARVPCHAALGHRHRRAAGRRQRPAVPRRGHPRADHLGRARSDHPRPPRRARPRGDSRQPARDLRRGRPSAATRGARALRRGARAIPRGDRAGAVRCRAVARPVPPTRPRAVPALGFPTGLQSSIAAAQQQASAFAQTQRCACP